MAFNPETQVLLKSTDLKLDPVNFERYLDSTSEFTETDYRNFILEMKSDYVKYADKLFVDVKIDCVNVTDIKKEVLKSIESKKPKAEKISNDSAQIRARLDELKKNSSKLQEDIVNRNNDIKKIQPRINEEQ